MSAPACISPFDVVEAQFEAYNAQNLEAFCAFYADHAALGDFNGAITANGIDAIRARHVKLFADFPQNKAQLLNRVVVGNTVIDHERVARTPGGDTFDVAAIYTIADAKIVRVDFVK
ncbi:nuclear transport factor 2 family protein [Phenylobacterium sp.]|uniref:nuclear transport factor 2 family protein n=1 Tax=Phenylobacterium sp. TaxID=1871053 RepID=UPI002735E117|nr:nuclear transport factor 2 family protein [Phenylobacterium sp.]MDP3855567.1 nuclear transport factor 2 family protein [Phenylobacterium sp.]